MKARPKKTRIAPASHNSGPARRHRFGFRILAATVVPVILLALLEGCLWIFNIGYPTGFLLPSENHGEKTFIQNNQFTRRFFGARLGRHPHPFSFTRKKMPNTIRIFVFGESAAYGDPQPEFSMSRMLEALLALRHPGTHFEVINTGITAINSHVIHDIARDCARAEGDIWVLYMGNNEVVGPCGGGTVFGLKTPPLPIIRAGYYLKATRTGELFDTARTWLQPAPTSKTDWGGMEMFLGSQLRADDPHMEKTYDYFARNLADIIRIGRDAGAKIVVSTVAVNLKDCAPFGSLHRANLSDAERERWNRDYQAGVIAQKASQYREALNDFQEAARIDDTFADLRFRQAQCELALGNTGVAERQFVAARDLDTLRFRCDSKLNEIIRGAASNRGKEGILVADSEKDLASRSPENLPGTNFFYEHVHLNFHGNYLVACGIGEQMEKLLPGGIATAESQWPSEAECAQRLGLSGYNRLLALEEIRHRLEKPPFTSQLNHESQMESLASQIEQLKPLAEAKGIVEADKSTQTALQGAPDDPNLVFQLAMLKARETDLPQAADLLRKETSLLPSDGRAWGNLGLFLSQEQKSDDSSVAFQRAIELDPLDASLSRRLGHAIWNSGRPLEAVSQYKRALAIQPDAPITWLEYGQLLEVLQRKLEASACIQRALETPGKDLSDLATMAQFCESRLWFQAASTNYLAAIRLDPANARWHTDAGNDFAMLEKNAEAEAQFRQALELNPGLIGTRINLAVAMMKQDRYTDATAELNLVLRQQSNNAVALRYLAMVRQRGGNLPATP